MSVWGRRAAAFCAAFLAFVAAPEAQGGVNVWTGRPPKNLDLEPGSVYALAIDPVSSTIIYAGTGCHGAFRSADGGIQWTVLDNDDLSGMCIEGLLVDPTAPGTLYVGTSSGTVFKTMNGGDTWSATGLPTNLQVLVLDFAMPTTLYAGTRNGVFKRAGDGEGWTTIGLISDEVSALAVDPTTPTRLYAGSARGIFRSLDGGTTWSGPELMGKDVRALTINPATPTILYAATIDGVFGSSDGGNIWKPTGDLGSTFVLAVDPITPMTMYAGTAAGVAKSTDAGATWRDLSAGLPVDRSGTRIIRALAVDPRMPTRLYAGTAGSGVFAIDQVSECASDCNDNELVTVDEILRAVAIALGRVPLSTCVAGDTDGDGTLTVDEITVAVQSGLNGCPPRATPTPTVTVTPTPTSHCVTALTGPQYFPYWGGSGCIDVAAPADCCWEATVDFDAIPITSASTGCGDGRVCLEVRAWSGCPGECSHDIMVGGKTLRIYQDRPGTPAPPPTITRTPTPTGPTPSPTKTASPTPTPTVTSTGTPAAGVFAYIVEWGGFAMRVVDTADNRDVLSLRLPSGEALLDIAMSADKKHAYVASSHRVFVVDTTYNVLVEEFSLPHSTKYIATGPSPDLLFASAVSTDELDVIQAVDGVVDAHIPIGGLSGDIVIASDGARAYLATQSKTIAVVDLEARSVLPAIALDARPVGLAISPDDDVLYATSVLETVGLEIVDTATGRVRGNVQLEHPGEALAATPDGQFILTVHSTADSVSVIDARVGTVLDIISVGDRPSDVAVTPDGIWAYVTNHGFLESTISVIDIRSRAVVQTLHTAGGHRIAIAEIP